MKPVSFPSVGGQPAAPTQALSGWSIASWLFFGLVVLSSLAFVLCWLFVRADTEDPIATFSLDLTRMVGMMVAYWAAWGCALAGTITGLIGVRNPAQRTGAAWLAVVLNGAFWLAATGLLWALSPS